MLQKQNFFISLAQGIDTKTDDKQVIPGKLLLLENAVFISPKEITKRNGNLPLSLTTETNIIFAAATTIPDTLVSGNFLANFNKEIILNDNLNLYSYSQGLNNWVYKAQNTICELSIMPVIRNINNQTLADSALSPIGIQVFAWEDSLGNSRLSIIDTQTGQVVVNDRETPASGLGTTVKPKCAYIAGFLVIFYLDTSVNMHLKYITYSNGIFSSPITIATDVDISNNNYDIVSFSNKLYIVYNTNSNSIKVTYLTNTLSLAGFISILGENADNCITIFVDLIGNIWISYADSTSIKSIAFDEFLTAPLFGPTLLTTISDVYNITGTGIGQNGASVIFYDVLGVADINGKFSNSAIYYSTQFIDGSSFSGQILFLKSASLQSKSFSIGLENRPTSFEVSYVLVNHDSLLQSTYFLCNLYNITGTVFPKANIVSKVIQGLAGGTVSKKSSLSSINTSDTNIFQTAILQKDLLFTSTSSSGTVNTYSQNGVASIAFDFTKDNLPTLTLGENLHISSGMLSMYDGNTVVEHNFHLFPEDILVTLNTSGGNLTDSSAYGYQVTYEWTDNQGQLHRSAPSPIVSVTTTATGNDSQGILTIPTLRITAKENINIVIYRTQANGTVYYRLNLPNAPLYNSTVADSVIYIDNYADSAIGANEQLYTTGGEVVNSAAPATSILGEYKNRIILIPSDNPTSVWFSKQVIPGSPVEFSDVFVFNIGTDGGPLTAFIQMDSNGIFFKNNSIFYISGDGPSPSGANNDFSQALSIASDVGCIDSQSLVLMPSGILFKSNKGIYLLTRSLEVKYIGADVEAFNNDTVTSAKLIVYTNQIRFTLDSGKVLVYDYFVNEWSVFTNIASISSIITADTFTYLQSNGLVLQETPGVFNDNGAFIKMKLTTSWLSLSGIQGFQRIYKSLILGKYFGPHKLSVQFAYDFNPIVTQQTYINATSILSSNIYGGDPTYGSNSPYGGQYPLYQWRVFNERQTCQSVQITIQDEPFSGTYTNTQGLEIQAGYNESLSLSAISLELGIKKGLQKSPAIKSFG